ncbi:MAG: hypothetical protein LBI79_05585, partial [Nitrososphaerota archaeon]|nr:hypothetical protein [Nitrososphaerota archaeon]
MKKKLFVGGAVFLLLVGLVAVTSLVVFSQDGQKQFYVGVTYCGRSIQEAKDLIDQVKDYTNLFILQSGTLKNTAEVEEIGDYAIAANLHFAFCNTRTIFPSPYSSDNSSYIVSTTIESNDWSNGTFLIGGDNVPAGVRTNELANAAKERWGERFIGVYYEDELGGKMLDILVDLKGAQKSSTGVITVRNTDAEFSYYPNGEISVWTNLETTHYYPNGTITLGIANDDFYTSENITKYNQPLKSYEQILEQNPIKNYDDAAQMFIDTNKAQLERIDKAQLSKADILVFSADYGLYWWDYQSGYDVVLAELGWNNTVEQEIGLVRGAANLQGKSWGTILTWTYTHPPYLTNGEAMYQQMRASYEAGAEYVIIFNYSENSAEPNTLQEEHFLALERFWKDVVQNPAVLQGGVKAEAALVLPRNYGWGMRNPHDTIWGIWSADDVSQEIWNQLQSKIDQYGLKLDIVFEDP